MLSLPLADGNEVSTIAVLSDEFTSLSSEGDRPRVRNTIRDYVSIKSEPNDQSSVLSHEPVKSDTGEDLQTLQMTSTWSESGSLDFDFDELQGRGIRDKTWVHILQHP